MRSRHYLGLRCGGVLMFDQFSSMGFERGRSTWPEYAPKDLELRLLDALSYRNCVSVRPDRYPRHFQGSRSSTFVIL